MPARARALCFAAERELACPLSKLFSALSEYVFLGFTSARSAPGSRGASVELGPWRKTIVSNCPGALLRADYRCDQRRQSEQRHDQR